MAQTKKTQSRTQSKASVQQDSKKPTWLKHTEKDIEAIIVKLAKQDLTSEKIGLDLRDTYGIPKAKLLGKKINQILKKHDIDKDSDLKNLENKKESIKKHIEKNKQDKKAVRAMTIISHRIQKLMHYRESKEK